MNFLAHYLLTRPSTDDGFILGSLLPDIARRAGVQVQASRLKGLADPRFEGLMAGIELHWLADRKFHQSHLFQLGVALWKVHLEKRFPGVERKFFLFHLLFEMWLDRLLLARNPVHGTDMYDSLLLADREILSGFSLQVLGDSSGSLGKTYEGFIRRKFILDYRDEVLFARTATEVFSYVTQQSWKDDWMNPVRESLAELEKFESDVLYIWDLFEAELQAEWAEQGRGKW